MTELGRYDKLDFGKNKGVSVQELIEEDPSYLLWAIGKDIVTVPEGVLKDIRQAHTEEDDDYYSEYYIGCPEQN